MEYLSKSFRNGKKLCLDLKKIPISITLVVIIGSTFYRFSIGNLGLDNILVLALLVAGVLYVFLIGKMPHDSLKIIYLLYMLYALMTVIWSPGGELSKIKLLFATLPLGIISFKVDEKKYLFYATIVSSIIIVLLFFFKGDYYSGGARFSIIFSNGSVMEQNFAFGYCFFPISYCFTYIFSTEKNELKIQKLLKTVMCISFLVIVLYYILITGSRGTLITFFAMFAVTLWLYRKNIGKVVLFIIVSVYAFIYLYTNFLNNILMERLSLSFIQETGASNRTIIWSNMLKYFGRRSMLANLFGDGIYSVKPLLGITSHSVYLECFSEYGIIGFSFFVALLVGIIIRLMRQKNNLMIITFCGILVWGLSIAMNNELMYWCMIFIVMEFSRGDVGCDSREPSR
jgi:hypothetical protein